LEAGEGTTLALSRFPDNRCYRPQATNAADAFDHRSLFFKHFAAAGFAEL